MKRYTIITTRFYPVFYSDTPTFYDGCDCVIIDNALNLSCNDGENWVEIWDEKGIRELQIDH